MLSSNSTRTQTQDVFTPNVEYAPYVHMMRIGVPFGAVILKLHSDCRSRQFIADFTSWYNSTSSEPVIVTAATAAAATATAAAAATATAAAAATAAAVTTNLDSDNNSEVQIESTINHLLQFHTNKATAIVDDIRDFTRPWRTRLRDILFRENEKYVKFLEKNPDDWPGVDHHTAFFKELGRQTTSFGTSWIEKHVNPIFDKDAILAEIDAECAHAAATLGGLRKQIVQIMDNYLATLNKVFQFHAALDFKITQMTRLKSQIESLEFLDGDTSEEGRELQVSALKFLQSKYRALGIAEDYIGFCKEYARFQAYRSVLGAVQAGSDMHGVPICSICASGTVVSALIPCGHVYCNTCAQKQRSQCYVCRTTVTGTLRIYFN